MRVKWFSDYFSVVSYEDFISESLEDIWEFN